MTLDDQSRPQDCSNTPQAFKKSILSDRVHHHARQKRFKLAPKTTPRQSKIKTSYDVPNINAFGYSLKPPEKTFVEQNAVLRSSFWKM